MRIGRSWAWGGLVLAVAAFYLAGFDRYLSFDFLREQQATLAAFRADNPLLAPALFVGVYIAVTALSLPGAAVMSLAGGALFGLWTGVLLVSFASSIGATLAMLVARFLLREAVSRRLGPLLKRIDEGIARDGAFHLFALRLVPIFPFFAVNLALGLTRMPARSFYWVSQLGMLPATVVYLNLGTRLGEITSLQGLVSPGLLLSLALLGVFPLLARQGLRMWRLRRRYAAWSRPARFDYNLLVIGAGSGGLVSAYIAAATQARVALVEQARMGGDCLNHGCVPSKSLLRAAHLMAEIRAAGRFGLKDAQAEVDFPAVMARVAATVDAIAPHDSVARYTALGVDCVQGTARLLTPWTVEVQTAEGPRVLSAAQIVIATGARPSVPPLPGLDAVGYLTSDTVWSLTQLPRRLVVLGGGPVGCELAQAFARLGAQVVIVQQGERLLPREDPEVSALLRKRFAREGIAVLTDCTALACEEHAGEKTLLLDFEGREQRLPFDELLVAVGRTPNTDGLGLAALGIPLTPQQTIASDEFLATNLPNIFVCGDVAGPFQLTHAASHQAWYAAVNALFGGLRRFRADYRAVPWCTFTDPQVARVGLSETEARAAGIAIEVTRYDLADLDRAIADGETTGFVKVLTPPGSDRILGVTLVGADAGELIAEFTLAMTHGLGLNKILGTVHLYPSRAEANKYAAGLWKRAQVTRGQRQVRAAWHRWQRGEAPLSALVKALPALWRARERGE